MTFHKGIHPRRAARRVVAGGGVVAAGDRAAAGIDRRVVALAADLGGEGLDELVVRTTAALAQMSRLVSRISSRSSVDSERRAMGGGLRHRHRARSQVRLSRPAAAVQPLVVVP